jgi:hypothetical protein
MKIRAGFVANSSTSSYLLIGVEDNRLIEAFMEAQNITFYGVEWDNKKGVLDLEMVYGIGDCNGITYAGSDGIPFAVGIDAESILENVNIREARIEFQKIAKQWGIDIPISRIKLLYGEAGN